MAKIKRHLTSKLNIRIPDRDVRRLQQHADSQRRTISDLARIIISDWLERQERLQPENDSVE
jgi:predicted transcriptional regulator